MIEQKVAITLYITSCKALKATKKKLLEYELQVERIQEGEFQVLQQQLQDLASQIWVEVFSNLQIYVEQIYASTTGLFKHEVCDILLQKLKQVDKKLKILK